MHHLLKSVILVGLWAVQGSHGRFLPDPTQRPQIQNFHQPPEPTVAPGLRYEAKRQQMSMSELAVTQAPDETCGYLSGRAVLPITCENSKPCMWATEIGMICGDIKGDLKDWQVHYKCMDREMALNPVHCNDTCIDNPVFLLCTEESAPYCATYLFPDAIVDYRCSSTPGTRASSADFTYRGQENAGIVTTIIPLDGRRITTTKPTESSSSADSTSSTTSASSSPSPDPPSSQNNLGAIIGGAIGGFAALSFVIIAIFWFIRQSKRKQHPPPTQVSQMEQAPLSDSMAGKPVPTSPVQSEWRGSMMTAFSSPHSTSPQGWPNAPVSPSAQSEMSQGILPPRGSNLPHEMSGESVQRQAHEMGDSRVYEMEGDPNHRWA
ncbi:uncharacterized protein B0J16DRAFT_357206 [Fusarium flagelliforme]|uniref:uncharacterized protein n=1 Tax=Fusarium flagelliforme TaxID=2675880 RepID=UPI001E8D9F78|nr:uncharacterized protein B0J16DRAFT_357206 [Fusarium flagelliforme]KAH7179026.1 hypothetical protein B0J16DRAFT_357206 [Fusarium flagelliforme]